MSSTPFRPAARRVARRLALFALLALAAPPPALRAQSATFDFNALALGTVPGGSLAFTVPGFGTATFSGTGLRVFDLGSGYPGGDRTLTSLGFSLPIRLDLAGFTATSIQIHNRVDGTGPAAEVDVIRLTAFDGFSTQIGQTTSAGAGQTFVTLAASGAAAFTFDDVGTGFSLDDVVLDGLAVVNGGGGTVAPEPATLGLLGTGVVMLGGASVRRRRLSRQFGPPAALR